jgi:hypothetical protein
MKDVDCYILGTTVLNERGVKHNLNNQSQHICYSSEILNLIDKLNTLLNSSVNAKVLMPTTPQFLLELVDLLLHKISD